MPARCILTLAPGRGTCLVVVTEHRYPTGNLLLNCLEKADFALLQPHLREGRPAQGDILIQAGARVDQLCFPEGGVASVHEIMSDGSRVGIGILGREGFVGWQVLLSCEVSPHETMIAIAGPSALWIDAAALLEATDRSSSLKALLLRFIQAFLSQMSRTIVSNLGDSTERRLSRWLLMNHDRIEGDCIDLTHSQIGVMLGVRRATVTDTLHILEGEALIRSTRGRIAVRDREGLKRLAGESYGVSEEQYRRLVAPFGREDG